MALINTSSPEFPIEDFMLCRLMGYKHLYASKPGHKLAAYIQTLGEYEDVAVSFEYLCYVARTDDHDNSDYCSLDDKIFRALYFRSQNFFTNKNTYVSNYFLRIDLDVYYLAMPVKQLFNSGFLRINNNLSKKAIVHVTKLIKDCSCFDELFRFASFDLRFASHFAWKCACMVDLKGFENMDLDMERLYTSLENTKPYPSPNMFDIQPICLNLENVIQSDYKNSKIDPYDFVAYYMNNTLREELLSNAPIPDQFTTTLSDEIHTIKYYANLRDFIISFLSGLPEHADKVKNIRRLTKINGCDVFEPSDIEVPDIEVEFKTKDETNACLAYIEDMLDKFEATYFFHITKRTPLEYKDYEIVELCYSDTPCSDVCVKKIPFTISTHTFVFYTSTLADPTDDTNIVACIENLGIRLFYGTKTGIEMIYESGININMLDNRYVKFLLSEETDFMDKGIHIMPRTITNLFKYNRILMVDKDVCDPTLSICTNNFYSRTEWNQIFAHVNKCLEKLTGYICGYQCTY